MSAAQNQLIERLPRKDRLSLLALGEPVQLAQGQVLSEPGADTRQVYFPVDGSISLVAPIDGRPALEVGMVGMVGREACWARSWPWVWRGSPCSPWCRARVWPCG